jgi:hypothetical protein
MTDPTLKAAGAAQRGDGVGRDAGVAARGRATQRPSRGGVGDEDGARVEKARRSAWLLAGLALFFYVGYMAWIAFGIGNGG